MRPQYSIATPPDSEPITLEQVAAHVRVDSTDDQEYIIGLLGVARELVDGVTGRVSMISEWLLTAQTWDSLTGDTCDLAKIYRTPLVSVESVRYFPAAGGALATLSAGDYRVITTYEPGMIQFTGGLPALADRPDAIQISFTAGYANSDLTPAILKHAQKVVVADMYEQRGSIAFGQPYEIRQVLRNLLENQKVEGWVA
jgi:uncharacterized phiE125 gp8 family phage protein